MYDADKKERKLSEFLAAGKKTILAFYPGAFTGTCTEELCTFRDMFADLQAMNAQLVAISVDGPFAQKAFAEKYDFKRKAIRDYDVVWEDLSGVKGVPERQQSDLHTRKQRKDSILLGGA